MKRISQINWINYQLNDGFEFRSGVQRTTVGIDMWDRPYILKGPKGENVAVYFMDTQGCFDQQTDTQDNGVIFAMSTLLSSNIIFNVMKQMDESTYQFLEYFVNYARLGDGEKYREDPFARLMILIRDFQSNDYDYGYYDSKTSINGKNYKKDLFDVNKDQAKAVQVVHQKIAETFQNISFFLMSEPGKELGKYGRFDTAKVDEDFVDNLKQLVTLVLKPSNLVLKQISGQLVYGPELTKLAGKWSQFFNSKDMPDSRTIFQSVMDVRNGMSQLSAINFFDGNIQKVIKQKQGVAHDEFEDLLRTVLKSTVDYYKSRMKGCDQKSLGSFIEELVGKLDDRSNFWRQLNYSNEQTRLIRAEMDQKSHEIEELKHNQEAQKRLLEKKIQELNSEMQSQQAQNAVKENEIYMLKQDQQNDKRWQEENRQFYEAQIQAQQAQNAAKENEIYMLKQDQQNDKTWQEENRKFYEAQIQAQQAQNAAKENEIDTLKQNHQSDKRLLESLISSNEQIKAQLEQQRQAQQNESEDADRMMNLAIWSVLSRGN